MALPDYLQEAGKDFAKQLTAQTSAPINTDVFMGRQFVAGEDPLQSQAIGLATQGIGSYQPYLQTAQTLTGPGAGTGAGSVASFMSPYQQGVIDETLRQFDQSRAAGMQQISDQAYNAGAFGGGRQGALEGQYMADTTAGRAGIVAQLQQQNFMNAQNQRSRALQDQIALSNFQRQNLAGDVGNLGQLGAFRQGLTQSQLAADQQALQTAAYEPFQRLDRFGAGITSLAGGVGGQQFQAPAAPSPFSTALSTALGIGGLFGKFK